MKEFIKSIEDPSSEYRTHPFWSWNDKLDPEMLRHQIREMKRVGIGGYFMHARGGLITEYLSEDWFDCIKAGIDEGKKLGMEAWSYDENGWPSGFGGGIVSGMGDKYHVRWLVFEEYSESIDGEKLLGIYGIKDNRVTVLASADDGEGYDRIVTVRHEKNGYYVDILNPEVVAEFIKCTYEVYKDKLGEDFGKYMPGFFTDEPQFSRSKTPWSYILPEEFCKDHGYEIYSMLPCLFYEYEGYEKFRFDFWQTVSRLYTDSFGKQIYDWCTEHGCKLTGHAMAEDNLLQQMSCTAGVMPIYQYMHIPGIDKLGRSVGSPLLPKQVASVARQTGKKHVITETFAMCGWDVSFEEMKWIADWQFINGVDLLCQHLESYSIRGLRKRDFPPSLFYQAPWWDEYKKFNDYAARIGKLIADTEEEADTLLLHPMHTAYIAYRGGWGETLQKYDDLFTKAINILSGNNIGYHFGDECVIKNHGSVEGDTFKVGLCSYKTVILPAMRTLDSYTFELLLKFKANGGRIYCLGEKPALIDGARSEELISFMSGIRSLHSSDSELLTYELVNLGLKKVFISGWEGEITDIHTRINDTCHGKVYFFQNRSKERGYDAKITLDTDRPARIVDLLDMSVCAVDSVKGTEKTTFKLRFEPMQSYIVVAGDELPEITKVKKPSFILPLGNEWKYDGSDVNALTLDSCRFILGEGETYSEPANIMDVTEKLLDMRANDRIKLKFDFEIAEDADVTKMESFKLVSEFTDDFTIYVNGKRAEWEKDSYYIDRAFRICDIAGLIKNGTNEIIVEGNFYQRRKVYDVLFGKDVLETEKNKLTYDTELEALYLIGDFEVYSKTPYTEGERRTLFTDGGFYIVNRDKNRVFAGGEIVRQGYPFFRGKIRLSQDVMIDSAYGKNIKIKLSRPYASLTKVYVNDVFAGEMIWGDHEVDISGLVKSGETAKITLELIISNRNILGPHHFPQGEHYWISPWHFSPHGRYDEDSWRERYCFLKEGIGE